MKTKIIAEIGINFAYGRSKKSFIKNIFDLIEKSISLNCDFIKFQKRNPDLCINNKIANTKKIVPWRKEKTTYMQYKKDIEISENDLIDIFKYCNKKNIIPFCSVWDLDSAKFMKKLTEIVKIPSPMITNKKLLIFCKKNFNKRMISTGMSTEKQIEEAINILDPQIIFHTTSSYPTQIEDLNLNYIIHLKNKYKEKTIGYSGHESGVDPTVFAVAIGAEIIERHLTKNIKNWGSDQSCSLDEKKFHTLIKKIKNLELCLGKQKERKIMKCEKSKIIKLKNDR